MSPFRTESENGMYPQIIDIKIPWEKRDSFCLKDVFDYSLRVFQKHSRPSACKYLVRKNHIFSLLT
eukprot:TRINITY_DN16382_c0_g1_i1.p3 TRINITY_DN16382_c0_g1~~TRINITY_DN16382_c0_g1_i1.p3  ORF type:complete len:66 (-),score=7.62 TRINITY_DN16382_c0_g1_i1:72-269(-)